MLNHPLKHSKFPVAFSLGVHDTSLLGGQILFSCFCCNFPPTNFIGLMFSLYLNNDDFPGVIVRPACQRSQPILISSSPIRMIHQQSTSNNNNRQTTTTINKQQSPIRMIHQPHTMQVGNFSSGHQHHTSKKNGFAGFQKPQIILDFPHLC